MKKEILHAAEEALRAISMLQEPKALQFMETAAQWIVSCFRKGGKLLIAGNGGSLCDAMHFAEELTGQFRKARPALPAIALSDPGHLTCVGNDLGFESVFARSVEALGTPRDVLIVLTTSGNSANLIKAVEIAKNKGLKTIAFLGKDGGKIKGLSHLDWVVSGFTFSDRIQEVHMAAIHIIIERVEWNLFYAQQNALVGELVH